jgi:hypothetical protein
MSLDREIEWWTQKALETKSDAALVAFGVATGLNLAKADYGAKDPVPLTTETPLK